MTPTAVYFFIATISITLAITVWAARRLTNQASSYYVASSKLTRWQNGLALAGDCISAAAVLGIGGLYVSVGIDASIYAVASMAGLCLILVLLVGPLKRLGRYTIADVVDAQLPDRRLRTVVGFCSVTIALLNLLGQLVGAGWLTSLLFGIPFDFAVSLVGALMACYVIFGGMLAATGVQIVKAVVLTGAMIFLAVACITKSNGIAGLYEQAAALDSLATNFGGMDIGLFSALSLSAGLMLGLLGMPHILIRFFTVPDETEAKYSLVIGATIIGSVFAIVLLVICPAAILVEGGNPHLSNIGEHGAANMIVLRVGEFFGGEIFAGFLSAVIFSTILAVVAGLTLAISSAISHDLVPTLFTNRSLFEKEEIWAFRLAAIFAACTAVSLAILFKSENIAFLAVTGSAVAASTTFPILVLSIYWRKFTAQAAKAAGVTGLITSLTGIILGPSCWVKTLGFERAIFPSDYPTLVTVPITFLVAWVVALRTQIKAPDAMLLTRAETRTDARFAPIRSSSTKKLI